MIFNDRVKALRIEKKLTQTQVAEASGMILRSYQRLEKDAKPHYESLMNLAEFFDVSVDYLMGRTDKREVAR